MVKTRANFRTGSVRNSETRVRLSRRVLEEKVESSAQEDDSFSRDEEIESQSSSEQNESDSERESFEQNKKKNLVLNRHKRIAKNTTNSREFLNEFNHHVKFGKKVNSEEEKNCRRKRRNADSQKRKRNKKKTPH